MKVANGKLDTIQGFRFPIRRFFKMAVAFVNQMVDINKVVDVSPASTPSPETARFSVLL
jgi:hypothetical protein